LPRNGSGIYSLPAQYLAETGQTIEAVQHNTPLEDLAADANNARPIVAGGTGEATAVAARQSLGAGATSGITDKAAGTYTAVKNDYNQFWRATGAVTINLTAAATLKSGWCMWVQADGGDVTVDPNGTEQINGAATITISDGGWGLIICTGSAFRLLSVGDIDAIKTALGIAPWIPVNNGSPVTVDFDTITAPGWYSRLLTSDASGTHGPPVYTTFYYVQVIESAGGNLIQIAFPYRATTEKTYIRTRFSGSWTSWKQIAYADEVYAPSGTDVSVPDGGTGRSSHTAYAVLCGGTTTTAAQQSIASVGSSGQVLTSNGAGALPTFQSISVDYGAGNAALGQGDVGTYTFAQAVAAVGTGSTIAGSNLKPSYVASAGGVTASATALSGTWRNLGNSVSGSTNSTLFLRVS
jgi:hypothetical protein